MERRWLFSALAALAVTAAPSFAEDRAPDAQPPSAPAGVQAAPVAAAADTQPAAAPTTPAPLDTVRLAQQTPPPAPPPAAPAPAAPAAPAPPPAPKLTYGAQVDFFYENNFNNPYTDKNQLRAFDIYDGGAHLGLADVWAQYARDPVGGRIDLAWGTTAREIDAAEPTRDDLWEHVLQAYVSANPNKKGSTYMDFGKWATTAGAETWYPHDNWLYSRGLLFTYAVPLYHLGARFYHYYNDTDYVMAGVERGWNAVSYPNHDPGGILSGAKQLNKQWLLTGTYIGGQEIIGSGIDPNKSWRNLFDVVAAYTPNAKWSHSINFDYAEQTRNEWHGISLMSKYQLTKKSYLAGRAEWLRDDTGALFGTPADAYSLTGGYTYVFNKYVMVKGEFREDINGGEPLFEGDAPMDSRKNQAAFIFAAVLSY